MTKIVLTEKGEALVREIEAKYPVLGPAVQALVAATVPGVDRFHKALDEGMWLFYNVPNVWLAVGQLRARQRYSELFGGAVSLEGIEVEDGASSGSWGLTYTNDCWALWEVSFNDQDEVDNMLLVNGRLPEQLVQDHLGTTIENPEVVMAWMVKRTD